MNNKVLIITFSQDNSCVDIVSEQIKNNGMEPIRFNTDLFPEKALFEVSSRKGKLFSFLTQSNKRINLQQLHSVWYRRSHIGESLQGKIHPPLISPVLQESQMIMWAAINSLPVFHLDHYILHRILENKLF